MARIAQSREELEDHLRDQLSFLRSSATAFDAGNQSEAKRLATVLRILLHNREPHSHALLVQLSVRHVWSWLDTAGPLEPHNLLSSHRLVATKLMLDAGGGTIGSYEAMLGDYAPTPGRGARIPFKTWWRSTVMRDSSREEFSRFDLVAALANQDGGAHVDPKLREAYHRLSRSNSLGWLAVHPDGDRPLGNPVPPSIRQIAYEVDTTITAERPDLAAV